MLKFQKTRKISLGIMVLLISGDLIKADNQNNYGFNPIIAAQRFGGQVYENLSNAKFATAEDFERRRQREAGLTSDDSAGNQASTNINTSYNKPNDDMPINKVSDDKAKSQFSKSNSATGMEDVEYGDETRLLEALGENVEDYVDIVGTGTLGQWRKSHILNLHIYAATVVNRNWKWTDLNGKTGAQIASEKKVRKENVIKFYTEHFQDKAYEALQNDIEALQYKMNESKNEALKKQLVILMASAKDAAVALKKESFEKRFNQDFRPSVTGESIKDALDRAESAMRTAENKEAYDIYFDIANKLKKIQQEVTILKNRNQGSVHDALQDANKTLGTIDQNKAKVQYDLFIDIVAALQKEDKAESMASDELDAIKQRVSELVTNFADMPADALEEAERQLVVLKDELKTLNNARGGRNSTKIKEQNDKIRREEEVIKQLKNEVKKAEADDKVIAKRVDDLLAKHDDDASLALEEIQDKIKKMRSGANKIDKGIEKFLQKQIKDNETAQAKYESSQSVINDFVKKRYIEYNASKPNDIENNPIVAFEKLDKELTTAQVALKEIKDQKRASNAQRIKEKQKEIDEFKLALDVLKAAVKKFNDKVSEKMRLLLLKNNQDDKKALQSLLSTIKNASGYYGAVFGENENVKIKRMPDPADREVAIRLQRKIKSGSVNDPLSTAMAKLNAASGPVETMTGMYAVIDASLAKAGSPVRMGTLAPEKRIELARALGVHQKSLLAIGQEEASAVIKHDKKKIVIAKILEDASRILAQDIVGVSYDALKTGNVQLIAGELALNKLVTALAGGSQLSSGDSDASYVDPQADAYEALGLSSDASQAEIRAAYLNLAKVNHPDMGGDTAMFQRISNAYELLKNN